MVIMKKRRLEIVPKYLYIIVASTAIEMLNAAYETVLAVAILNPRILYAAMNI